ncbi:MAG: hypothetical protein COV59_04590 [Candidatus Magasanikbacteria bacterium CG11_big_fil_rev_8_21_14_0_20_39_34]|uniref:Uncharacterized protein n=1 Tax=Candidatus Magasanikbacteria bacterium CG11_big_fil_rev_8_21_14_0_20_39_34 TaxID=1974653 RepID=A0A2H0N4B2_9BACT|nr:MAG: hypothetical protein COV59_04590 [Candidatus Magasanikbacteria bacterium CG11_big_fil_rev_8_21_14_0_20_39_34]
MKKSLFLTLCISLLFTGFVFVTPVHANFNSNVDKQTQALAGNTGASFGQARDPRIVVANVIRIIISILGMGFLAYLIYAGSLWMTAGGNDSQVDKAKSIIRTSVIGLVIIFCSYMITIAITRIATGNPRAFQEGIQFERIETEPCVGGDCFNQQGVYDRPDNADGFYAPGTPGR